MSEAAKLCPHCGEEILAVAIKCRFCGVALDKDAVDAKRADIAPPVDHPTRFSCPWVLLCFGGWLGAVCGAVMYVDWWLPVGGEVLTVLAFLVGLFGLVQMGFDLAKPERKKLLAVGFGVTLGILLLFVLAAMVIIPNLFHPRGPTNESVAIGSLKIIGTAQTLYREADKEGDGNLDYGSLKELANSGTTGLIDGVLGSGTKAGYVFTCTYGASTSEFIWFATASPVLPTTTGDRYFATNHEGVIFWTVSQAFSVNSIECTIPPDLPWVGQR